jgi:hypothetical protein
MSGSVLAGAFRRFLCRLFLRHLAPDLDRAGRADQTR